jgi:hypothetical protein
VPTYFTLPQAEAALPKIEPALRLIRDRHAQLLDREERLAELQAKMMGNGHGHHEELRELRDRVQELGRQIAEAVREIQAQGILVKDLDLGLIDFPALREGREVYLCWRLGEEGIGWWHEVEAGYAGRQPISSF